MKFLSTFVACCGAIEHESSAILTPFVSKNNDDKNLVDGLIHEKKLGGGGKVTSGKSARQPVQWRPSLCTISEEEVVMVERIQLCVKPNNKLKKKTTISTTNYAPSGYKNEFV